MATKTQYYNLDKPSYDEVADIEIINANMDKIDQQMRNNADGVNFAKAISSDAYDNSKLYAVGDYCIYDNKLYRCITAIESAEAFNIANWEQTTVGREVKQLNSNLSEIHDLAIGANFSGVAKYVKIGKCICCHINLYATSDTEPYGDILNDLPSPITDVTFYNENGLHIYVSKNNRWFSCGSTIPKDTIIQSYINYIAQ